MRKVRGGRGGTSGRPPRRGSKLNNDCCAECIVAFFVWQLQDFRLRQSYDVTSRRGQERRMMLRIYTHGHWNNAGVDRAFALLRRDKRASIRDYGTQLR